MNIINLTTDFEKNYIKHKRIIVFHWTATKTATEAIDYLKSRLEGKGTVGYNYIIDENGDVFMLANPCNAWMHNSAMGTEFDKNTISISFVNIGDGLFSDAQIVAAKELLSTLKKQYEIIEITNHHKLYAGKPDFPDDVWQKLLKKID